MSHAPSRDASIEPQADEHGAPVAALPAFRLALLASLSLFLELAIIRFAAANVLYLGYFGNFVLVSAFLGIGVGFLLEQHRFSLVRVLPESLAALLGYIVYSHVDASVLRRSGGVIFFGLTLNRSSILMWVALPMLFVAVAFIFACVAQETARAFRGRPALSAYSLDVAGSMAGIALFTGFAWLRTEPLVWFFVVFAGFVVIAQPRDRIRAALVGVLALAIVFGARREGYSRWSPYQHVEVWPLNPVLDRAEGFHLAANGIGHQRMQKPGTKEPIYDFPYREVAAQRKKPFARALIIGAGSGTDVAYALAYGVQHVDAVEIDPEILAAGRKFHPARPYDDPRVTVHNDDGRAFLQRTQDRYDLIIFALPDSLASLSSLSNLRLEGFLFTQESLAQAAKRLTDDGVIVLYNYYRKEWLVSRLAGALGAAIGRPPLVATWGGERMGMLAAIAGGPTIGGSGPPVVPLLATDDWPFLYVERLHVPPLYLATMALFVGCALLAVGVTGHLRRGTLREHGPLLLMGAAFLLLETKSVVQFSLLFGATWAVNAMVFFSILASVLCANLLVSRLPGSSPLVPFLLLTLSLVVGIVVEPSSLLSIASVPVRYVAASVLWFAPIFFANVAFARLFRDVRHAPSAFGLNVVGTAIGGALEFVSLAIGYQLLAVVVTALYVCAAGWALLRARRTA